jgi:uncharacterized membrane protein YeaQ/YmgE (transglycosylase-associated protein family)
MLALFIDLIIGGIIGWIASLIMKTDKRQGPLTNIAVGVAGSFLAGLAFNNGRINREPTLLSLGSALLGAIVLLALINLIWRKKLR